MMSLVFEVLNVTSHFSPIELLQLDQRRDQLPDSNHFEFRRSTSLWFHLHRYLLSMCKCWSSGRNGRHYFCQVGRVWWRYSAEEWYPWIIKCFGLSVKTPPLSHSSVSLYLTALNFRTRSAKPTSNILTPSFFADWGTLNFARVGNNWCFQVTESSFVPQVTWPQQGFITRDPKCPHQLLCTVPNAEKEMPSNFSGNSCWIFCFAMQKFDYISQLSFHTVLSWQVLFLVTSYTHALYVKVILTVTRIIVHLLFRAILELRSLYDYLHLIVGKSYNRQAKSNNVSKNYVILKQQNETPIFVVY